MTDISYRNYLNREYEFRRAPYEPEMEFYDAIKKGHVDRVAELTAEPFSKKNGLGTLSYNELRNIKYHFVITVAMIARECIKGGLSLSESYSISDYYIEKADRAGKLSEIDTLHTKMCLDYAERMHRLSNQYTYSGPIIRCIEYIYENLGTRITLPTLSSVCGLSEAYLSRLFKKETGYTVSAYILYKKLETAKSMLLYSGHSISEISASLAFPSQSYFTNVLKNDCGMTPLEYRKSEGRNTLF